MGRSKKDNGTAEAPAPAKHGNGYDPEKTHAFVERIENLHDDIAGIMGKALNECKQVHGDIKLVYDEAKAEAGIPKKVLKKVVRARELERKVDELRDDLEGEEQESFDQIRHALGDLADTPLGKAALDGDDEPHVSAG